MKQRLSAIDPNIWVIVFASVFAWAPLLTPAYFFEAHDARHSVFFLVEFDQTWRDGYLWPRWSPDFAFGYGYPLFSTSVAPLAYYAAQILHLLGLGLTASVKTMFALATVGAGLSTYLLARRLFGRTAGLLAGIVYMYVPFHLAEIYVRAAYAEFVALALLPLILWAFTALLSAPTARRLALAGLVYGLLPLTHPITFFTFTFLLAAYILYLGLARLRLGARAVALRLSAAAGAGLLGLALAAIFLLPVVAEQPFIQIEQWRTGSYNYLNHFVYASQLFSPFWGYGYSGPGLQDDTSFQLGIAVLGLMVVAGVRAISRPSMAGRGAALFFIGATAVLVWLMSPAAEPVWRVVPLASLVQFPWRLLNLTALTMAVGAGALLAEGEVGDWRLEIGDQRPKITNATPQSPIILLALVVILGSFNYALPQYTDVPDWAETPLAVINWDRASIEDRVAMVAYTQEQPRTSPMEAQYLNGEPLAVAGLIAGEGQVETLRHGGASDEVRVRAETPVTLQFYTYDFPGWRVIHDGRPVPHRPEPPYGLITVDLPPGEHHLFLRMGATPPRIAGGLISGLALLLIVAGLAGPRRWRGRGINGA
ncbi:MAG: 6-pyruvoyl-tetrahydropterin synthase-related protein [Anaerolineae bacterium]